MGTRFVISVVCGLIGVTSSTASADRFGGVELAMRVGIERASYSDYAPEWGGFVDGEAGAHVYRHISVALFGVVARTSDVHDDKSHPVGIDRYDDHYLFVDFGVRARAAWGPLYFGLGFGGEHVVQSGSYTSLGTIEPPGSWSSSYATTEWLADVHAGYTLPSIAATCGCSPELFVSYDFPIGRVDSHVLPLHALRVGLGMTFR